MVVVGDDLVGGGGGGEGWWWGVVGGGGGGWVCKPILVFSLGQAEQKSYQVIFVPNQK